MHIHFYCTFQKIRISRLYSSCVAKGGKGRLYSLEDLSLIMNVMPAFVATGKPFCEEHLQNKYSLLHICWPSQDKVLMGINKIWFPDQLLCMGSYYVWISYYVWEVILFIIYVKPSFKNLHFYLMRIYVHCN